MKNKNSLIVSLFVCILGYSQTNFSIEYETVIVDEKDMYGLVGATSSVLITNTKESLYITKVKDTVIETEKFGTMIFSAKETEYDEGYKNITENIYYSKVLFPGYILKDKDYTIEWEIQDNFKNILEYSCQEATCSFRGRNYKAYFTTEIPIKNGPYKFDGLPGLILEVISDDKTIWIKAKKVSITNVEAIENPFMNETKFISWDSFVEAYKKYFNRMIAYKPSEDTEVYVPNRGIEYYITD
jgi:GLPGLI family protein